MRAGPVFEAVMFESLGERLTGVFDRLTGRGVLSERDVEGFGRRKAADFDQN